MKTFARCIGIVAVLLLLYPRVFSQGIDTSYLSSFRAGEYENRYTFRKNIYHDNSTRFRDDVFARVPGMSMVLYKTSKGVNGDLHYKYLQQYQGIPVEASMFIVHCHNGVAISANGRLLPDLKMSTSPGMNSDAAVKRALQYDGAKKYEWEMEASEKRLKESTKNPDATYYPQPTLVIGEDKKRTFRLMYKMVVTAREPFGISEYFIDAHTGELIAKQSRIDYCGMHQTEEICTVHEPMNERSQILLPSPPPPTCTDCSDNTADVFFYGNDRSFKADAYGSCNYQSTRLCSGVDQTVLLYDDNAPPGAVVTNTTDDWGTNHRSATTFLFVIDKILSYYQNTFGRSSYDGSGGAMENVVEHWFVPGAMWHRPQSGTPGIFISDVNPPATGGLNYVATAFDIMGHEFGHGITRDEATFFPTAHIETGPVFEGVADIFGIMAEFYGKPQVSLTPNYLIGEDCFSSPNCKRDLKYPNNKSYPDTYMGDYYVGGNGDTYTNCNIIGHWFYLLAEGSHDIYALDGGENDNDDAYCVEGLGMEKASLIFYEAIATHTTTMHTFNMFKNSVYDAIEDLYGATSYEMGQAVSAFYGVGMEANPYVNGPLIIDGHTITAAENIHWNDAIEYQNTTISNGYYDVSSSVSINMYANTSITTGTSASFYIAPDCAGGARMSTVPDPSSQVIPAGIANENALQVMEKKTEEQEISIFPNPTDGMISIGYHGRADLEYTVFNMQGDVLMRAALAGEKQLSIKGLENGVYLLQLVNRETKEVKQFRIVKM